jgi:16S rRNA (cytosine967-C5)-methyltransferase
MSGAIPARRAAFEVLRRVFEQGAWADRALPAALKRHGVAPDDRPLAQRLAYGAVQRRGTSDHVAETLSSRPVERLDAPIRAALRLGLYELLYSKGAAHAVVDEAVELAKSSPEGRRGGGGLVNAVLRRAASEREAILSSLVDADPKSASIRHSYPTWLAELWWEELGPEDARALMEAGNRPAETALRANELRIGRDELLRELADAGVRVAPAPGPSPLDSPESILVSGPIGDAGAEAIADGRAVGQSRASVAAVRLLDPRPGERVLDLCAGPGLKTTQLAARMRNEGEISSLELRPQRARQVRELAARLGAEIVHGEVRNAGSGDLGGGYDRVLVDPPCSDLGTLASRPDARWRKHADDPARLADLQRAILAGGAGSLAPGGTLVYSTCTISVRENEEVVESLLRADGERLRVSADPLGDQYPELASGRDRRFLQTRPDRDGTDGFFIARLRREG